MFFDTGHAPKERFKLRIQSSNVDDRKQIEKILFYIMEGNLKNSFLT